MRHIMPTAHGLTACAYLEQQGDDRLVAFDDSTVKLRAKVKRAETGRRRACRG